MTKSLNFNRKLTGRSHPMMNVGIFRVQQRLIFSLLNLGHSVRLSQSGTTDMFHQSRPFRLHYKIQFCSTMKTSGKRTRTSASDRAIKTLGANTEEYLILFVNKSRYCATKCFCVRFPFSKFRKMWNSSLLSIRGLRLKMTQQWRSHELLNISVSDPVQSLGTNCFWVWTFYSKIRVRMLESIPLLESR